MGKHVLTGLCLLLAALSVGCDDDHTLRGTLDCQTGEADWWRIRVDGPTDLSISVDTVSSHTAFDPVFQAYLVTAWGNSPASIEVDTRVLFADDDFPCTFPPPAYECPAGMVTVDEDVALRVERLHDCAGTVAAYNLNVTGAADVDYIGSERLW